MIFIKHLLKRYYSARYVISSIILVLLISSCSEPPSEICINGIFKEDCTVTCVIDVSKSSEHSYINIGQVSVSKDTALQKIYFVLNQQQQKNIIDLIFYFNSTNSNEIFLYDISLKNISELSESDLYESIHWMIGDVIFDRSNGYTKVTYQAPSQGTIALNVSSFYLKQYKSSHAIIYFSIYILLLIPFIKRSIFNGSVNKKFLLVSVLLYITTIPLKISWANWTLGLLVLISLVYFVLEKKKKIITYLPFYLIISLYVIAFIGSFCHWFQPDKLIFYTPFIIFPIIFSITSFDLSKTRIVLHFFTFSTILYCLCSLLFFFAFAPSSISFTDFSPKHHYSFLFPYPSFAHPSFIAIIISMAIPTAVYLKARKEISWLMLILSIILISTVVFLSGARIGLAVVPLLLILSLLFYIKIPQYIKYIIVGIGCILAFILFSNPSIKEKFEDPIRQDLRKTAIAAIKEKPLFGWGTSSMKVLLQDEEIAQKAGLERPRAEFGHFHNQYLDMLAQFGFIGSIPFFVLFAYLIYLAIKRKDFLLMAYLAIYLSFMFVESPLATNKGIQPMIFWLCFLLSTQKIRLKGDNPMISSNEDTGSSNVVKPTEKTL